MVGVRWQVVGGWSLVLGCGFWVSDLPLVLAHALALDGWVRCRVSASLRARPRPV